METLHTLLQDPAGFVGVIFSFAAIAIAFGFAVREAIYIAQHRRSRSDRQLVRHSAPLSPRERSLLGDCWYDRVTDYRKRED